MGASCSAELRQLKYIKYEKPKHAYFNTLTSRRDITIPSTVIGPSFNDYLTKADTHLVEWEFPQALYFYQKCLDQIMKVEYSEEEKALAIISIYQTMALTFKMQKKYKECLEIYQLALEYSLKNLPANHLLVAGNYSCVGEIYYYVSQYSLGMDHLLKALKIRRDLLGNDDYVTLSTYQKIALIDASLEKYEDAIEESTMTLKCVTTHHPNQNSLLARAYENCGLVNQKGKKYKEAIKFYNKALKFYQKSINSAEEKPISSKGSPMRKIGEIHLVFLDSPEFFCSEIVDIYLSLAYCYLETDRPKAATENFYQAAKIAKQLSNICFDQAYRDVANYVKDIK